MRQKLYCNIRINISNSVNRYILYINCVLSNCVGKKRLDRE